MRYCTSSIEKTKLYLRNKYKKHCSFLKIIQVSEIIKMQTNCYPLMTNCNLKVNKVQILNKAYDLVEIKVLSISINNNKL